MVEEEKGSNNRIKRLSKIGLIILLSILLILSIIWYVLRSDHAFVIRKVQETALDYFDIHLKLEGYRLEWTPPYPLIRFELRGLSIAAKDHPQISMLRVNTATSEFNPWDLITGDFQAHPFQVDSTWIHLYTDSTKVSEQLAKGELTPEAGDGLDMDLSQLPDISINYLDFHREDDYRHKWQWAKFSHLHMQAKPDDSGNWWLGVKSDCHFEGLVFKEVDGGFLMDTPAELDLQIALAQGGQVLHWENSRLTVGSNKFALKGQYEWAAPNRIQLQIRTDGITLAEARPLLSKKIRRTLNDIQVDQPIRTEFYLDNQIVPGRKEAIRIEFFTNNAAVQYKAVEMSAASLNGTYSNDCDEDGIGNPQTSCITFHQLDGDFFGLLPAYLQGVIHNLEDPRVDASGRMDVKLPNLNPLLAEKGKATFSKGHAMVNFEYDGPLENVVNAPFDDRDNEVSGNALFDQVTLATADRSLSSPSLSGYLSFNESQTLLEDIDLEWMGAKIQLSGRMNNLPEFFFYENQTVFSDLRLHFDQLDLNQFKSKPGQKKSTKKRRPANGKRLEEITRQLANNVNGQLFLQIDKLIYDTLYLTDLTTRFRIFSLRQDEFADSAMVQMDSLRANFMGNTPVYAHLEVSRDLVPELTAKVYLPSAVPPARNFLPTGMKITKGRANLALTTHLPLQSILAPNERRSNIRYNGLLQLQDIEVAHTSFSDPIQQITGPIKFDGELLHFDKLQFQYNNAPFELSGQIHHFTAVGQEKATANLQLIGKQLDLRTSGNTATKRPSQLISPPKLFRSLKNIFRYGTGEIDLILNKVITDKQSIQPFRLKARLLPDEALSGQYQLRVDSFNLGFGKGNYFKGDAWIRDPENPGIQARIDAQLEFAQLGRLLPSKYIEMRSGDFKMDLRYQSPLYDTLNAINYLLNAEIDGQAELADGQMFYNYRDFSFENMSGRFRFDQQALYIQDLDLEVNGNRLMAHGQSKDFFSFFVLPDRRAHIDLEVRSPRFDFGSFTAPQGLQKDTLRILRKADKLLAPHISGVTFDDTTSTFQQTAGYIDQLLDRGSIEMSTDFKEVVYEDFNARQVDGHISLASDTVQLHNLHMQVADGSFSLAGLISNIVRHEPKMEVSIHMDKNNVREIFRQFDNFGQGDLGYKNVEGLISADLKFQAKANSNYSILPETMHGDLSLKLAGGELVDLKLFDKLSGFLFRNRGLDHIILDTLVLHSHIRGSDLYVDDFFLHSSPFDFGAEGRYSLGAENHTRVLFSVPVGNLFNRHISPEKMQEGDSRRKGLFNILIEARYKKGKMRFIWRPFVFSKKKYRLVE